MPAKPKKKTRKNSESNRLKSLKTDAAVDKSNLQPEKDPCLDGATTPEAEFESLCASVREYLPESTIETLDSAFRFAMKYHGEQRRRSGELYVTHPLAVANILTSLRLDVSSIIAAILHDTVEDTDATIEDIEKEFGEQVAQLVDGLTKLGKIQFQSSQERMAENFRKMILAMAKDLRVILIKLADRLHNMRTIDCMPEAKIKRISEETLDIYAPLANRLGIYGVKSELEDICLRQLKPDVYSSIRSKVAAKKSARQSYIEEIIDILQTELKKYHFKNIQVYGRPKHFYSIYKKMIERKLGFEDIHDLFAFRIVVDSIKDCYEALGVVHAKWKPMPGRFKDYIAMPKANLYQSLHTTVIRPNGEPAEIQIRTHEMQSVCEYGIAAHWAYKEQKDQNMAGEDLQKFSWLRQIVQWQSELKDPDEFLEAVKVDLFDEEIFVFTPKGDVISLPRNATALDFAFAVHTDVGLRTIGVKVNAAIAPIKRHLRSGDIVEVLTSPNQRPSKDWLNFVLTSKARNKIRSALRSEQRQRSHKMGEDLLEQALEERQLSVAAVGKQGDKDRFIKFGKESSFDDVLIAIGYGRINAEEIVAKVYPGQTSQKNLDEQIAEQKAEFIAKQSNIVARKRQSSGILVSGLENVMVSFAKCCHPLPGEEITGFITRGRGVTVHRKSCSRALDLDPHRKVDVSWGTEQNQSDHTAYVRIVTHDKTGVLAEVTQAIAQCGASTKKADIRVNADLMGVLDFELGIHDLAQLEAVIRKIENIPAVLSVERKSILETH